MGSYISWIAVMALSSVKFLFAPALAVAYYNMSFVQSVLITSIGGCIGVVFFTHLSKAIINMFATVTIWLQIPNNHKPRRTFTFRHRMIVRIKQRYGLWGLVILTPVVFSIPLGSFLAERYFPRRNTMYDLFLSVFVWSLILNGFFVLARMQM